MEPLKNMIQIDQKGQYPSIKFTNLYHNNGESNKEGFSICIIGDENIGKNTFIKAATSLQFKQEDSKQFSSDIFFGITQYQNYKVHLFSIEGFKSQNSFFVGSENNIDINSWLFKKLFLLQSDSILLFCELRNNFDTFKAALSDCYKEVISKICFVARIPKYKDTKAHNLRQKIKQSFFSDSDITTDNLPLLILPEFDDENPSETYIQTVQSYFNNNIKSLIQQKKSSTLQELQKRLSITLNQLQEEYKNKKEESPQEILLRVEAQKLFNKDFQPKNIEKYINLLNYTKESIKLFKKVSQNLENFQITNFEVEMLEYDYITKKSAIVSNGFGIASGVVGLCPFVAGSIKWAVSRLADGPIRWISLKLANDTVGWSALGFSVISIITKLILEKRNKKQKNLLMEMKSQLLEANATINLLNDNFQEIEALKVNLDIDYILVKCINEKLLYYDEQIKKNGDIKQQLESDYIKKYVECKGDRSQEQFLNLRKSEGIYQIDNDNSIRKEDNSFFQKIYYLFHLLRITNTLFISRGIYTLNDIQSGAIVFSCLQIVWEAVAIIKIQKDKSIHEERYKIKILHETLKNSISKYEGIMNKLNNIFI